jgi:V/A-type H+-transporting ATPase subunit I
MSKVEVIGPRDQLLPALDAIRTTHTLEIDASIQSRMGTSAVARLQPLTLDPGAAAERARFEELASRIDRLLALVPECHASLADAHGLAAVESIERLIAPHTAACQADVEHRDAIRIELASQRRALSLLGAVQSLAPKGDAAIGADLVVVEVADPVALDRLSKHAAELGLPADVAVARADDGTYIGLLTTERSVAPGLREALRVDHIPQAALPPYLEGLTLSRQIAVMRQRVDDSEVSLREIERRQAEFAVKWRPLYEQTRRWLREQLALFTTTVLAYETDHCFVIFGWLPSSERAVLKRALDQRFHGTVIVDEQALLSQDLDVVPVLVRNPRYLQPFELFTSLLPLPRYTSIDPTPFVAIFFPVFFGIILGDVGYGAVLFAAAIALIVYRASPLRRQLGAILAACSIYSMIFGFAYGEYFGEAGATALGVSPWIDRRHSFLPMLYFAIAVGSAHVVVGLVLGVAVAIKGGKRREVAARLLAIAVLLCILGVIASFVVPIGEIIRRPLLIGVALITPLLLLAGGLLAPFELIRHLGNIVSYARLMAVGLASVLLAYVANALAGAVGSVWVGVTVAVLLHAFNIVLGVFAPTIHALRLHYVEFFSKFFESGGRPYQPLKEAK